MVSKVSFLNKEKTSYKQTIKATSIFGGVQLIQILISIIRSKFTALILGPVGMGQVGLFLATTEMISSISSFGLSGSGIKNISAADGDQEKVGRIVNIFKRLILVTGILGMLITLLFSSYLSQITFGNKDYAWAFALLSITLLFNQVNTGYLVLLQSARKIRLMAKSTLFGSVLGLLTSVPMYYFLGINGIVPSLIFAAFASLFISRYFVSKLSFKEVEVDFSTFKFISKELVYMGFMIAFNSIIISVFSYFVRIFIKSNGNFEDVGLYNAGFAILNTYVGMIFNAMATDYFPRLSSVSNDTNKSNETINQQAEISIIIIGPIIVIFIVFIKLIIYLLYSKDFFPIQNMILYAAFGMLFKALSWSIAFIFLAKSSSKIFFINELIFNLFMLMSNLLGYYWLGLTGLGIAFLISYFFYALQVFIVSNKLYKYSFSKSLIVIFSGNFLLASISLFLSYYSMESFVFYLLSSLIIVSSLLFNLYQLDKKIFLKKFILSKWQKK